MGALLSSSLCYMKQGPCHKTLLIASHHHPIILVKSSSSWKRCIFPHTPVRSQWPAFTRALSDIITNFTSSQHNLSKSHCVQPLGPILTTLSQGSRDNKASLWSCILALQNTSSPEWDPGKAHLCCIGSFCGSRTNTTSPGRSWDMRQSRAIGWRHDIWEWEVSEWQLFWLLYQNGFNLGSITDPVFYEGQEGGRKLLGSQTLKYG